MTSTLDPAAGRVPIRTCIVCQRRRDKTTLLRISRTDDRVRPDPAQRAAGRGAYVCPDETCIERLRQRGGQPLERALPGATNEAVCAVMESLEAALATPDEHQRSNA